MPTSKFDVVNNKHSKDIWNTSHIPQALRTSEQTNSWYIFMYVVLIHLYVISYITNRVLQIPWCPHPRSMSQNTQISIWILHKIYKDHLNKKIYDQPVTHSFIQTLITQLLGARCCLNTGAIETNTTGPLSASSIWFLKKKTDSHNKNETM